MRSLKSSGRLGLILAAALLLCNVFPTGAKIRPPLPPWPEETLKIFGFDSPKGPWRDVVINADESTLVPSWSGYALERGGLFRSPVVIPVRAADQSLNMAPGQGAIRFWMAPHWSTVGGKGGGQGPGHLARLLELVNVDNPSVGVRWSLYLNEAGDTIFFSGRAKGGVVDLLKAPVEFQAGDWRLITLRYSETKVILLLDNVEIASGEGLVAPAPGEEKALGLVIGSDILASPESLADAQFEELITLDYWPKKSDWPDTYFQSTKWRTLLGPLGTKAEEQAKIAVLKAAGLLPADYGTSGKIIRAGSGPIMAPNYTANDLWLEITGVTNPYVYLTLHGTVEGDWYQLLSRTNLAQPGEWTLGEIKQGDYGTNQTDFSPVYVGDETNMFFRAHHAASYTFIYRGPTDAYEPNPVMSASVATFTISASGSTSRSVYYRISGTASNGGDYTNITSSVTVPPGSSADIFIHPLGDNLLEGDETVTLTLVQTNDNVIPPAFASATILIKDFSTLVQLAPSGDAFEADGPPGVAAQTASFVVTRYDEQRLYPPLTVPYSISGSAGNGTDYVTLTGTVTFLAGASSTNLIINPLPDTLVEGIETVTLTLLPTNTYAIDTNSATVTIADSSTTVEVHPVNDAIEPNPASNIPSQTGRFSVVRRDTRGELPALTVSYQVTGTATSVIDYTNLTGTVTIPLGLLDASVFIEPLFDGQFEEDETVTLTLALIGDGYLINTNFPVATITIVDNLATNTFQPVVTGLSFPAGIDYHQPSNSLIVSVGSPSAHFVRILTNTVSGNLVTVVSNWSGVAGLPIEVKLFTVKTTANGFTNGDVYFSSGNAIGWLSADGTRSNLNWCILTNSVETNALPVGGSLGMDVTGVFSNQLIVVTSPPDPNRPFDKKGVWRVAASGQPTLVTNFNTRHLEGVISLTNDVAKWGPWAGKIVTGDENENLIYAIGAGGVVSTFNPTNLYPGGIRTEDFEIIPPNQDLYACDAIAKTIVKLSRNYLTNHVGDLLITDAGEFGNDPVGKLFILHWDAATTNFITRRVRFTYPNGAVGHFEHVTFAPLNLPPLNP